MEIKSNVDIKEDTEVIDYKRIFYGEDNKTNEKANIKKERENKFIKVFFVQSLICIAIICSALILKYAQPETFESISSLLNGFYEDNITLSDLNQFIDERISNNDTVAAFFNFAPTVD